MRQRPGKGNAGAPSGKVELCDNPEYYIDADGNKKMVGSDKKVLNLIAGLLFALQSWLFYFTFAGEESRKVEIVETFPFVNADDNVVQRTRTVFAVDMNVIVSVYFFIAALSHFVIASPLAYNYYLRALQRGRNPFRWLEYSMSASIMCVVIGIAVGIREFSSLVGVCGGMVIVQALGYLAECRFNDAPERGVPMAHFLAWVPFSMTWYLVFKEMNTVMVQNTNAPYFLSEWTPTSIVIMLIAYVAFGAVQTSQMVFGLSTEKAEVTYVILSMVDKTFLGFCVVAGLYF